MGYVLNHHVHLKLTCQYLSKAGKNKKKEGKEIHSGVGMCSE